ncbi:MAG: hypothetical protein A2Y88_09110 [Chloroflexi bacterium RBG_13_48_10]|jgi:hypothetical protein|nr:MAG: hypothetical protein A2Y88_09110 [Chloroflexi bacterium RBG_13_48_10]
MPTIETETKYGESRQVGDLEITPVTRVLKIHKPGYHAGLIWNRPKAVIVKTSDGKERTLPVTDVTRLIIWGMLAGGILGAIMIRLIYRHR